MVKHIVMFKLPENYKGQDRINTLQEVKKQLEALPALIDSIKFYEVGLNFSESPAAFDIVINSDFEDNDGLKAYSVHEEHQKVVGFIQSINPERAVVDYEF